MKSLDLLILRLGCSHGFFGQNCANKCNSTCTGCNSVHGSCDSGCIPGWTGYYCNDRDVIPGIHEFDSLFQYNALFSNNWYLLFTCTCADFQQKNLNECKTHCLDDLYEYRSRTFMISDRYHPDSCTWN